METKKGGVILNDETIKPYVRELEALEAKLAKDKEQMATKQRIDDVADNANANNDANTEMLRQHMDENFAKAFPKQIKIRPTNGHTSRQRAAVTTTRLRKATM